MARSKPLQHKPPSVTWEQEQKLKDEQAAAFTNALAARSEGEGDGRKERWTPWLLIRYSLTDHGGRPTGDPIWMSPDIWVESSDPSGNAVAGEGNFVHVRIFNLGTVQAAPVEVDFYWANPALGLSAANMNLIGKEWVQIPPISVSEVRCNTPWVPVLVNGGHECLMVNCTNYILDPILYPFEPSQDRHVGQRNVTVVHASAGTHVSFVLQMNNAWPIVAETQILARTEHVAAANKEHRANVRALLAAALAYGSGDPANADQTAAAPMVYGARENPGFRRSSPMLSAKISDESVALYPSAPGANLANLLLQRDAHPGHPPTFTGFALQEFTLKPFELRTVSLRLGVPDDAKPGEFVVFHFAQIAENFTTGGYSIVIHVK